MAQYDFTLKFALGNYDADPDAFVERLLAEGSDDALIGVGQHGRIAPLLVFFPTAIINDSADLPGVSSSIARRTPNTRDTKCTAATLFIIVRAVHLAPCM